MKNDFSKTRIALVDYGSFNFTKEYNNSVDELIEILLKRNYVIYALLPTDIDKKIPTIDISVNGVFPYQNKDLIYSFHKMVQNIKETVKCSNENDYLTISENPALLYLFDQENFSTCRINNSKNDLVSLDSYEVNNVKSLHKLLRRP